MSEIPSSRQFRTFESFQIELTGVERQSVLTIRRPSVVKILFEYPAPKNIRRDAHKTQPLSPNWKHQNEFLFERLLVGKMSHNAEKGALSSLNAFFKPKQFV